MRAKKKYGASARIKERGHFRKRLASAFKVVLILLLLVTPIFILRADFMQIQNIEVQGVKVLSSESIKEVAAAFTTGYKFFIIPKSNVLVVDEVALKTALENKFGRLQSVEINKKLYNKTLEIAVKERKSDFLWCDPNDECYFMSLDGVVFEFNSAKAPLDTIIFRGVIQGDPLRRSFATPEAMTNYLSLVDTLNGAGYTVSRIDIKTPNKAYATTPIGDIIFNPEEPNLNLAAQNAITLIRNLATKTASTTFDYVDARFGNKVFYKLK